MWAVVVFPLDPVIAIIGESVNQLANSISPTIGIPISIAFNMFLLLPLVEIAYKTSLLVPIPSICLENISTGFLDYCF